MMHVARALAPACVLTLLAAPLVSGCAGDDGSGESGGATSSGGSTSAATGEPGTSTSGAESTSGGTNGGTSGGTTSGGTTSGGTTSGSTSGDASTSAGSSGTTGEGLELPWAWIAAADYGIRDDEYGLGHFLAPRKGYLHSGIDFSMPVGTGLMSPCDGVYLADYDGGYGNWVQVICPVPATISGGATVYASLLYAHLDTTALPTTGIDPDAAGTVKRGQMLGTSGKTGNASAAEIHAHLHFEVALLGSELAGLQEAHISGDDADTAAAAALRDGLAAACLEPTGFAAKSGELNLGRRIDPFMFLSCLSGEKPALVPPKDQALHAWSDDYEAVTFDVDVGM